MRPMVKLFLAGDVMTGRGIDQLLPFPCNPQIHEGYMKDARDYIKLAEQAKGFSIKKPASWDYIWGQTLPILESLQVDFRIINLETSVTTSDENWPGKGIHYRMNPNNIPCLHAAKIDVVSLANNHVLDWGYAGLQETLETLHAAGIQTVGAGINEETASHPAILKKPPSIPGEQERRVLVFAWGSPCAGVPEIWAATASRPGVNYLRDFSPASIERVKSIIAKHRQPGDIVVVSVHWGGNWGHAIPEGQRQLAHTLTSTAGVHVVFGHSSHHIKTVERHGQGLILYGCGDFINDYEGIDFDRQGHDNDVYRADLARVYVVECSASGGTADEGGTDGSATGGGEDADAVTTKLHTVAMKMDRFQLHRAEPLDEAWVQQHFGEG